MTSTVRPLGARLAAALLLALPAGALATPKVVLISLESPVVRRLADDPATPAVLSVPNFYGAHGYDPSHPDMSAIFYAAGPDIHGRKRLDVVRNIDVAPTIERILGVEADPRVEGRPLDIIRMRGDDGGAERDHP